MKHLTALLLALLLAVTPLLALAEESAEPSIDTFMAFVQDALDTEEHLYYERDDERYYYSMLFPPDDTRLGDVYVNLDVFSNGVLFLGCFEEDIPEDRIAEGIRLANLINADMLGCKLYVDDETGSIYYEIFLFLDFVDLTANAAAAQDEIIDLLASLIMEMDYNVEYFMAVIDGDSAENAFAIYRADYAN